MCDVQNKLPSHHLVHFDRFRATDTFFLFLCKSFFCDVQNKLTLRSLQPNTLNFN